MKNKRSLQTAASLCTLMVLILCSQSSQAYGYAVSTTKQTGAEIHWSTPSAGFYINTAGFPSGSLQAIEYAMDTWTAVPASNFSFVYRGMTTSTAYAQNDGTNIISFGALGADYDEKTLAVNTFWYNPGTGLLQDSDIKFNSSYAWSTDSSATAYDVQTLALHELGHALSLDDLKSSGDTAKVMYGFCNQGQIKRSLTQDDKDGITYLYGDGTGTTSTTTVPSHTTTTSIPVPSVVCPAETVLGLDNPDLDSLRALRDGPLARSAAGQKLIQMYYDNAESINAALERSPAMHSMARKFFEAIALAARKME
jgi:hypothetical protein